MLKFGDDGTRLCDLDECELPATHTCVWTSPVCYCSYHMDMAQQTAEAMGYPTPVRTLRKMTRDEMVAENLPHPAALPD